MCAAIGKEVLLCDIKENLVQNGINTITRNLQRSVTKKRINQDKMNSTLSNIVTTLRNDDLSDCDIIIEAIIENIDIKKDLFANLGQITKENTLINQQYIKDSKQTITDYINSEKKGLDITDFARVGLG